MAKQVAKVAEEENKAVVVSTADYGEYAGAGYEDLSSKDMSIPYIALLQANSPQVESGEFPDAKAGLIFNSVTGEFLHEIHIIPCYKRIVWVEWIPRNKGGGIAEIHEENSELVRNIIKKNGNSSIPPKGADGKRVGFKVGDNELVETHELYCLMLDEEGTEVQSFAVIPFTSTKIKPLKDFLTSLRFLKGNPQPPMFANRATISTKKEKRPSGSYFNYSIAPLKSSWVESLIHPVTESELLQKAAEFRKTVLAGSVVVKYSEDINAEASDSDDAPVVDGGKAPF